MMGISWGFHCDLLVIFFGKMGGLMECLGDFNGHFNGD
jgi:hypothetical protein